MFSVANQSVCLLPTTFASERLLVLRERVCVAAAGLWPLLSGVNIWLARAWAHLLSAGTTGAHTTTSIITETVGHARPRHKDTITSTTTPSSSAPRGLARLEDVLGVTPKRAATSHVIAIISMIPLRSSLASQPNPSSETCAPGRIDPRDQSGGVCARDRWELTL